MSTQEQPKQARHDLLKSLLNNQLEATSILLRSDLTLTSQEERTAIIKYDDNLLSYLTSLYPLDDGEKFHHPTRCSMCVKAQKAVE